MKEMLWQLHHQFPDGHTEFISQIELTDDRDRDNAIIHEAIKEGWEKHPPPKGAVFVIGNEDWEHFVK
jgi:hypothetical protein